MTQQKISLELQFTNVCKNKFHQETFKRIEFFDQFIEVAKGTRFNFLIYAQSFIIVL